MHGLMIKRLAILLGVLAAMRLPAGDLAEQYAPLGRLIMTNFASAPFPHPLRAQGQMCIRDSSQIHKDKSVSSNKTQPVNSVQPHGME